MGDATAQDIEQARESLERILAGIARGDLAARGIERAAMAFGALLATS